MARYRGPVEKIERRLEADLGLKDHLLQDNMDKEELKFLSMDYN